MIRLPLINLYRRLMDNHIEQATQYAKLSALYKTIIYLQDEVIKEQEILDNLKKKEDKNVS